MAEFIASNWPLILASVLTAVIIFLFTRQEKTDRASPSSYVTVDLMADISRRIVSNFTPEEQRKIARGMVAAMTLKNITPDRLLTDDDLFNRLMLQTIGMLTRMGEIKPQ